MVPTRTFWRRWQKTTTENNMQNKISATLSDADKATALGHFTALLALLTFLRNLTPEEKLRLNKAANGRLPFIQQSAPGEDADVQSDVCLHLQVPDRPRISFQSRKGRIASKAS